MLRRVSFLLASATLDEAYNQVEKVWNAKWGGKPTTHEMNFNDVRKSSVPMFHVLSLDGTVENPKYDPKLPKETCQMMMQIMVSQNVGDRILLEAQRQGRMTFYMTCRGEEAVSTASTAAIHPEDWIYMQYRETPACRVRGLSWKTIVSKLMCNKEDICKHNMPMLFGGENHIHVASAPLGTQVPQSSGTGYALRLDGKGLICMCFAGEGAASEGDFYAGLNFAATLHSHTLFFVRNNGFAISTPTTSQYVGDGILARGVSLGIPSIRVDGNDPLAIYAVTKRARELILERDTPVLIEAIAYRVGNHSTSDDSSAYRTKEEIAHFDETFTPLKRFGQYLEKKGWWNDAMTKKVQDEAQEEVMGELRRQETIPPWPPETLLEDVYHDMPWNQKMQQDDLHKHYVNNMDKYPGGFY